MLNWREIVKSNLKQLGMDKTLNSKEKKKNVIVRVNMYHDSV